MSPILRPFSLSKNKENTKEKIVSALPLFPDEVFFAEEKKPDEIVVEQHLSLALDDERINTSIEESEILLPDVIKEDFLPVASSEDFLPRVESVQFATSKDTSLFSLSSKDAVISLDDSLTKEVSVSPVITELIKTSLLEVSNNGIPVALPETAIVVPSQETIVKEDQIFPSDVEEKPTFSQEETLLRDVKDVPVVSSSSSPLPLVSEISKKEEIVQPEETPIIVQVAHSSEDKKEEIISNALHQLLVRKIERTEGLAKASLENVVTNVPLASLAKEQDLPHSLQQTSAPLPSTDVPAPPLKLSWFDRLFGSTPKTPPQSI